MPYISELRIRNHYRLPDIDIDLRREGAEFQHLILTGPNGSGKTTVLEGVSKTIDASLFPTMPDPTGAGGYLVEPGWTDPQRLGFDFRKKKFFCSYIQAVRRLPLAEVKGPKVLENTPVPSNRACTLDFHQYLVNLNVDARLASYDGGEESLKIFEWLRNFENQLQEIFDEYSLNVEFDRKKYRILFRDQKARKFDFDQLPAGYRSVIQILGELIMRIDAAEVARDADDVSGVLLIDEPELHLHPAMQERILPFLAKTFPRIQIIAATHSPIVLSSLENALIFDLEAREPIPSEDIQGTPYGSLMKVHFRIETDVDLKTTEKLKRLVDLRDTKNRSNDEEEELRSLAFALAPSRQVAAMEVMNRYLLASLEEE